MRGWGRACCLLLVLVSPANADWLEASSDHFVIYADQDEKTATGFAQRLELFHAAMARLYRNAGSRLGSKPSPSNRVTVFVLESDKDVRRLAGLKTPYVAGYYRARAGASVALVPKLTRTTTQYGMPAEAILLHEYAHHFMAGMTARAYPRWFVEGFAEFFASARFEPDRIGVGAPPAYRAAEFVWAKDVPIRKLLDFAGPPIDPKGDPNSFYAQSWALYHFLVFEPERSGQLAKYEALLSKGTPALEAAVQAFGDLNKLSREMEAYIHRKRLSYVTIARTSLDASPITVRKLRPGEAEMMPVHMESTLGVDREEALALLPEARRIAGKHAGDPAVLAALAEAEYDAGNDDAAIEAADRALAIDPREINARLQKGYASFRKVENGALPPESWRDVRGQFVDANKVENDHPVPLVRYYMTYSRQGIAPTRTAVEGLEWAMALAPYDPNVRWAVAQQMVHDQRLQEAILTLQPLAYSPHPEAGSSEALELLKELEARVAAGKGAAAD
jgi:tetratricopeptide (TPR) repeat protein